MSREAVGGQRGGSCLPQTPPRWGIAKQIQLEGVKKKKKSWSKELPNKCQLMPYCPVAGACAPGGTRFPVPSGREKGWMKPHAGVQHSPPPVWQHRAPRGSAMCLVTGRLCHRGGARRW